MELLSLLATVILVATIGTLLVAVAAYMAFRLRDRRKPSNKLKVPAPQQPAHYQPVFITRYKPGVMPKS
jgi:uncharacterized membrane protein YfcA